MFLDIYTTLCPRHFGMKPLFYGSETSQSDRIHISNRKHRGFSLIDQILSKLRGSELRRIWGRLFRDICTAQKDNAYIVTLWGLRCVDEYVMETVWKRRFENEVVRKTLRKRHCEKDVVKKTLWEKRCKKRLWER